MTITSEQLAASGSEHGHQAALFCYAAIHIKQYPELKWLYSVPNGFFATPGQKAKMKAEGLREGVSDICLPLRIFKPNRVVSAGLYIELKVPSKFKVGDMWAGASESQREFGRFVIDQGYYFKVCYGWEDAWQTIISYIDGQLDNLNCWKG